MQLSPKEVKKSVANDLKSKSISRSIAADILGMGTQTFANLLSQEKYFSRKMATRFHEKFGFDPNFLMTGEGNLFPLAESQKELHFMPTIELEMAILSRFLEHPAFKLEDVYKAELLRLVKTAKYIGESAYPSEMIIYADKTTVKALFEFTKALQTHERKDFSDDSVIVMSFCGAENNMALPYEMDPGIRPIEVLRQEIAKRLNMPFEAGVPHRKRKTRYFEGIPDPVECKLKLTLIQRIERLEKHLGIE